MLGNILSTILVIALVLLFAWLTRRAWRAQRALIKYPGALLSGLLTLLLVAMVAGAIRGMQLQYFPDVPSAPEMTVAGTPEQVARGEYLVNIACIGCHGAVDSEGNATGEMPLTGGWNIAAAEGFGFAGDMITENLTPGGKLASYSDGELFRAIRYRVNSDGHRLTFMQYNIFNELSDEDTEAIIAYLRSLPAVATEGQRGDRLKFAGLVLMGVGMFPAPEPSQEHVAAPPVGNTAEYGQYVATFGECRACHGPTASGVPASSLGPAIPNPRPLVGTMTEAQFFEMMHSGIRPGNSPFPESMPWQNADRMTDEDLAALYAYLKAAP